MVTLTPADGAAIDNTGTLLKALAEAKAKGDNLANLKPRVIAYYQKVLADRARPPLPRPTFGRPPGKPAEKNAD